jgi:hypothetical protein
LNGYNYTGLERTRPFNQLLGLQFFFRGFDLGAAEEAEAF